MPVKADVLVIEDENDLAKLIGMYLERESMGFMLARSAEEALEKLKGAKFDIIVLDINLPGINGFEFLNILRRDNNKVPVIVVSAREGDEDIVLGLGLGADEFLSKPVSPRVLIARIQALLRRERDLHSERPLIYFDDYSLDPDACLLMKSGTRIALSAKEFDILVFLITANGKAFSAKELYENVWGKIYGDLSIIGVYIQRLRRKLGENPSSPQYIETVQGKGYRFNAERLRKG